MKLKEIDKKTYRKRLNIVIVSFISCLLALALIYGQVLIAAFGVDSSAQTASLPNEQVANSALVTQSNVQEFEHESQVEVGEVEQPTNFKYNFLGVLLSLLTCIFILHRLRNSDVFDEVYYVWQVKQQQNAIYRKLKRIKAGADNDDVTAFIILNFYYASLKQIYLLDDNTLTISKLNSDIAALEETLEGKNLTISTDQFETSMVTSYS